MQKLDLSLIKEVKKAKLKFLEKELESESVGQLILCPFCKYQSKKNNKGTGKVFKMNEGGKCFKCFACGIWRRLE